MYRGVLDALEMANKGYSGSEIKEILEKNREGYEIFVALDTMEHLKKGGRVSATTAVIGTLLNIKPVLQFDVGQLTVVQKSRGMKSACKAMIDLMKHDLETKFAGKETYIQVAYSTNEETAQKWIDEVKAAFPDHEVLAAPLTLAVCCHIGENGLGIGCVVKPIQ
jgi:DegV family protein with EDD domain